MNFAQVASLTILAGLLVLFIWDRLRFDMVALLALLAAVVCGIVPANKAFTGFGNPLLPLIASALVVSNAVGKSGLIEQAVREFYEYAHELVRSEAQYRGIVSFTDSAHSWVGTRTLWNEHAYHVTNICDDLDTACLAPNVYGSIPKVEQKNWTLPWLNNFRQNVQDHGLFNAPDIAVSVDVACSSPAVVTVSVRNIGLASLPSGFIIQISR